MYAPVAPNASAAHGRAEDRPLLAHHVARMCVISRRTVRWLAQQGYLRGFKDPATPKLWRFHPEDVIAFMKERKNRRHTYYGVKKAGAP
jgi:hypothetical protein